MEVRRALASLPLPDGGTVATIGFFDGVHRGHAAVFRRTVEAAANRGLVPVAVTFDRHPRAILTPGNEPALLTTLERKTALIRDLGVGVLVVLEFSDAFSRWPPREFVDRVLVEGLGVQHVAVGRNFRFGHEAAGNLALLAELGSVRGFSSEGVEILEIDGRAVSSSSIRRDVADGHLEWPTQALGRRYVLDGTVTTGAGRGRGLGFPTANLDVPLGMLLPGQGVYAGKAHVEDQSFVAAINVGTNPTFGGDPLHVEAFLLDFDGDLSGRPIAVEFWARLRDELRFASVSDLTRQIALDVDRTRALVA